MVNADTDRHIVSEISHLKIRNENLQFPYTITIRKKPRYRRYTIKKSRDTELRRTRHETISESSLECIRVLDIERVGRARWTDNQAYSRILSTVAPAHTRPPSDALVVRSCQSLRPARYTPSTIYNLPKERSKVSRNSDVLSVDVSE